MAVTTVATSLFADIDGMDEKILQKIESVGKPMLEEIIIVVCHIEIRAYDGYFSHFEHGLYIVALEDGENKVHAMRLGRDQHNVNVGLAVAKLILMATSMEEPKVFYFNLRAN